MWVSDREISASGETRQGKWHLDSVKYQWEVEEEEGHSSGDLLVTLETEGSWTQVSDLRFRIISLWNDVEKQARSISK